jgi:hypothetical protein
MRRSGVSASYHLSGPARSTCRPRSVSAAEDLGKELVGGEVTIVIASRGFCQGWAVVAARIGKAGALVGGASSMLPGVSLLPPARASRRGVVISALPDDRGPGKLAIDFLQLYYNIIVECIPDCRAVS